MMKLIVSLWAALSCLGFAQGGYVPEEGSDELRKKRGKKEMKVDPSLPMVLILGDSISIGYTSGVRKLLKGKANVIHNPGNSQGTTHTLKHLDDWLKLQKWDVIHFNLGLHDLKRVKVAGSSQNSDDPKDPYQADLKTYTENLERVVAKLKGSGAQLIFATTTPFPAGVSPYRDPADAKRYNEAALKVVGSEGIEVNDLYALMLPRLGEVQRAKNVHFKPQGSALMAEQVAKKISAQLAEK
ncbi:SGNH/GDSL hydrolase family protein [Rubritalea tangerina]|uniref:SGNH/GDSL hydrolase family protein n=2 Tax=Rubritalea tangerina TaxID=430798 RepID=A0ABW4Z896_9BACT